MKLNHILYYYKVIIKHNATGFELVKQNRCTNISEHIEEKDSQAKNILDLKIIL